MEVWSEVIQRETPAGGVNSVHIALRILERVAELQETGVSDLARELSMPKSSVQRYLTTLGAAGWLESFSNGQTRWRLGSHAISLGLRGADGLGLRDIALPLMQRLRDETGEAVLLSVPDNAGALLIERLDSPRPIRPFIHLGEFMPYHASAAGLALLAAFPAARRERVLAALFAPFTANTVTDPVLLEADLEQIRERNFAINSERWTDGISGLGSVLTDSHGAAVAAISIAVPTVRFDEDAYEKLGLRLAEMTRQSQGILRH